MAENEQPQPETTEQEVLAQPKKGGPPKMLIVILLAVVLAGGGFFGMKIMGAGKAKKPEKLKVGAVMQLKEFLVNLADQQTFLRTEIALGIAEKAEIKAAGEGKESKEGGDNPQVRDAIIMILSAKKPSELATLAGKERLKSEIIQRLNSLLGEPKENPASADKQTDSPEKQSHSGKKSEENHGPVLEVYFTSFATQKY
jgi:flagellar FliL protein